MQLRALAIRQEKPEEFAAIYELVKTAFETAKVADGDEQDYVDRLRASDVYIPELALAAIEDGVLVGHVMLTKIGMRTDDDRKVKTLLLAPLSVALPQRGRGVGGQLVEEALRRAAAMGYDAVFLVGDPAYYSRFGFKLASEFGVEYTGKVPPQFVQACELHPGGLATGSINVEENQ